MNILEEIVKQKRIEIKERSKIISLDRLKETQRLFSIRNFSGHLKRNKIQVIAEIKRRSPAMGDINIKADPCLVAQSYVKFGAACISVLTDQNYFGGQLEFIQHVKSVVDVPVLRKDFIISEYQVWESFYAGADAILLIADILEDAVLKDLYDLASKLGLHVLVEIHDESKIGLLDEIKPSLIGVNCRNLETMHTEINLFKNIVSQLPSKSVRVAESGISRKEDLEFVFGLGFDAALIGTQLMREQDPGIELKKIFGNL